MDLGLLAMSASERERSHVMRALSKGLLLHAGSGRAAGFERSAGEAVVAGVSGERGRGADIAPARAPIAFADGGVEAGSDRGALAEPVSGLRRDAGGREAARVERDRCIEGDGAPDSARSGSGASAAAAIRPSPFAPRASSAFWRTDPDRRQPARLVRGSRPALRADRVHRRRHGPADGAAIRAGRDDESLSRGLARSRSGSWRSAGPLQRPARHIPDQRQGGGERRRPYGVWPRCGAVEDRAHPGHDAASQGPSGAGEPDLAGPAGQGDAASRDLGHRRRASLRGRVRRNVEREIRQAAAG